MGAVDVMKLNVRQSHRRYLGKRSGHLHIDGLHVARIRTMVCVRKHSPVHQHHSLPLLPPPINSLKLHTPDRIFATSVKYLDSPVRYSIRNTPRTPHLPTTCPGPEGHIAHHGATPALSPSQPLQPFCTSCWRRTHEPPTAAATTAAATPTAEHPAPGLWRQPSAQPQPFRSQPGRLPVKYGRHRRCFKRRPGSRSEHRRGHWSGRTRGAHALCSWGTVAGERCKRARWGQGNGRTENT